MMPRTLIIFAKEPRPGRVKTRLGREIGHTTATWWFRHQSARLIRELGADQRWQTRLALTPDRTINSRSWPAGIERMAQGPGDLGKRMKRALIACGPGPAIIIGADIPGIRRHHIADAFERLGSRDLVLGPAPDGGYWLIGVRNGSLRLPTEYLTGVRWSSPHALGDTVATAANLRIAYCAVLADIDTAADLRKHRPYR